MNLIIIQIIHWIIQHLKVSSIHVSIQINQSIYVNFLNICTYLFYMTNYNVTLNVNHCFILKRKKKPQVDKPNSKYKACCFLKRALTREACQGNSWG